MKGGVTQFTVEKTSTTKNFPHHDLGRRNRKEGGNELIILLLLPSLVFSPFIRHRVFFTPQWVLKQYFLYPSSSFSLLYLFFCNTTKLSKEINRFFSAFAQTLEVNVLEHVRGYFPPMSFAPRSARAEKPILFSCSSSRPIIMQILPFSTTPIHKRGPKLGFTG